MATKFILFNTFGLTDEDIAPSVAFYESHP